MKRFSLILMLMFSLGCFCYAPPPAPPGNNGDGNTNTGGNANGAPIDGGLGILLAMGAMYGGKKLYQARKEKKEVEAPTE